LVSRAPSWCVPLSLAVRACVMAKPGGLKFLNDINNRNVLAVQMQMRKGHAHPNQNYLNVFPLNLAIEHVCRRYRQGGGRYGWVFSCCAHTVMLGSALRLGAVRARVVLRGGVREQGDGRAALALALPCPYSG
jgi:hypothetical protein